MLFDSKKCKFFWRRIPRRTTEFVTPVVSEASLRIRIKYVWNIINFINRHASYAVIYSHLATAYKTQPDDIWI